MRSPLAVVPLAAARPVSLEANARGTRRKPMLTATAGALLVLNVACGGAAPEPTPAPPPAATAIPATTPAQPATPAATEVPGTFRSPAGEVGKVVWAAAVEAGTNAPITPATAFAADAGTIYAVVPVSSLAAGARLSAAWAYNGTPIEGFAGNVVADGRAEHAWAEFHINRGSLAKWPTGTYQVTISLNDTAAQVASVEVGD